MTIPNNTAAIDGQVAARLAELTSLNKELLKFAYLSYHGICRSLQPESLRSLPSQTDTAESLAGYASGDHVALVSDTGLTGLVVAVEKVSQDELTLPAGPG